MDLLPLGIISQQKFFVGALVYNRPKDYANLKRKGQKYLTFLEE